MLLPENKIIAIEHATLSYGTKVALENINLDIYAKEFLLVTGPNGGGKTSLLRMMLGLQKPTSGNIHYFDKGSRVTSLDMGYLPQKNNIDSHFPITVKEVIASGLLGNSSTGKSGEIDHILNLVEIAPLRNKSIGELSGGQLQRALFGRALISRPTLLILDEPSSYLDRPFSQRMVEILHHLSQQGTTIVVVSHETELFAPLANRTIYVDHTLANL